MNKMKGPNNNHVIGQNNVKAFGFDVHNPVFTVSSLVVITFVVVTLLNQDLSARFFGWLLPWLIQTFDWFLVLSVDLIMLFCFLLVILPVGRIKIGGKDALPDYSYLSWVAMLFAAGIGIGLMFFGVLEPVYFTYAEAGAAHPLGIDPSLPGNQYIGVAATIHHWGLAPWSVYAVVGLTLAIFYYNKGLPLTLRSAFFPIFGNRVWGRFGDVIDITAVFASLFGLTTSLGLGAKQIAAGMQDVLGIQETLQLDVLLIVFITFIATVSVVLGMDKGIKRLSQINMVMAVMLFLFVLFATNAVHSLGRFGHVMQEYLLKLAPLSNPFGREDVAFFHNWTTFYWAWWVAWSPFVGIFIARISKGRTVREFIICVLFVPTTVCALWMSVFGGAALDMIHLGHGDGILNVVANEYRPELSLFRFLDQLPYYEIVAPFSLILIVIFFVTSSDSGSLVIDMITAGGKLHSPIKQRVFWCVMEGLVAISLLLGGGLVALQGAACSTGIPFTLIVLAMCVCLYSGLRSEKY